MSVKITSFDDPAAYPYVHDDAPSGSHDGTLDPTTLSYGKTIDGSDDLNIIAVPCPFEGCGSVSYWPPGGGADALLGQSLHVVMAYTTPGLSREAKTAAAAAAEVKQRVIDTDGEERWVLDEAAIDALRVLAQGG